MRQIISLYHTNTMFARYSPLKLNSSIDHIVHESFGDSSFFLSEKEYGVKIAVANMSDNRTGESGFL
jgi:hypothetical protein